ncbi:MAG: M14 family metallocarboxypeptidase [Gammaproteobacteria bacterium]
MNDEKPYPIGTPGVQWGDDEKSAWFAQQSVKRSYREEVLEKLTDLAPDFELTQYGALSIDEERYPLYIARSTVWHQGRPALLVTGGVHGYETSGVQGAIRFLTAHAKDYAERLNVIVAPCVSPWGYETINRWNPIALDPNRSFSTNSPSEEAASLMKYIGAVDSDILIHIDLHETTDTDNTEFRPALAARDAKHQAVWDIPDGFYTVGNSAKPEADFQRAIIESVAKVTHIAPPDANGTIIGAQPEQEGVINYDAGPLGLCMGMTDATFVTTTEVYPDSPKVDDENCIEAQVAAVRGGVDYVLLRR